MPAVVELFALFDRDGRDPRFPFGHGLTYSQFEYSGLRAGRREDGALDVAVTVTNTGTRAAIETPQLYIGWPGKAAPRPKQSLRGFSRVPLAPGESAETVFTVEPRDLAWYDASQRTWRIESGLHTITVARSARDPRALSMQLPFEREFNLGL